MISAIRRFNHGDTEDTEEMDFSLAGRRRPGKSASAFGASLSWKNPAGLHRLPQRNCPKGCVLLPDRRLPIGQKKSLLCALCASVVNQNQLSLRLFTSVCPDDLLATAD
jgi:hypothetical protein